MGKILTELSFDEWIRHMFDHPVSDPEWHWDDEADSAALDPGRVIAYVTELFERSGVLLAQFSDGQVNQGLWFLISIDSPLFALNESTIPVADRVRCIQSISALFEQCFAPRCTPHLSHRDEPGASPLNAVCYMWWDLFPISGHPKDQARREIDEACLSVMATTLELPSVPCQESALHGLGHWSIYYLDRCPGIISQFLQRHCNLRPELAEYAARAREANVL